MMNMNHNGNLKINVTGTVTISLKGSVVVTNEYERGDDKRVDKDTYQFNDVELSVSLNNTDINVAMQTIKEACCGCKSEQEDEDESEEPVENEEAE